MRSSGTSGNLSRRPETLLIRPFPSNRIPRWRVRKHISVTYHCSRMKETLLSDFDRPFWTDMLGRETKQTWQTWVKTMVGREHVSLVLFLKHNVTFSVPSQHTFVGIRVIVNILFVGSPNSCAHTCRMKKLFTISSLAVFRLLFIACRAKNYTRLIFGWRKRRVYGKSEHCPFPVSIAAASVVVD